MNLKDYECKSLCVFALCFDRACLVKVHNFMQGHIQQQCQAKYQQSTHTQNEHTGSKKKNISNAAFNNLIKVSQIHSISNEKPWYFFFKSRNLFGGNSV